MRIIVAYKTSPMFRLIVTLALLVVTGVMTLAYSPAFIVWAFYLFQLWFKLLISYWEPDGTVSVKERFWTGLVQLAVTLLMLTNPTPPDDTTWSYAWMGTAFLFLCAGSHNLYTAAKVIMPRFKSELVRSSERDNAQLRELEQQSQMEQKLLADLSEYLADVDSGEKQK